MELVVFHCGCDVSSTLPSTGVITTVAGTTAGLGGDGGPAVAAQLNSPHGIAISDGKMYIADWDNHRIRCMDVRTGMCLPIPVAMLSAMVTCTYYNIILCVHYLCGGALHGVPFSFYW